MRGIKVVLLINFVLWALYGLVDLFFPAWLVAMNMGQDSASARHVAAIALGLAVVIWGAFKDPAKHLIVIDALVVLNVIDLLVGVFQSLDGTELWKNTVGGMVMNVLLGGGLVVFRPRPGVERRRADGTAT